MSLIAMFSLLRDGRRFGADLDVAPGMTVGLFGPSGVGKSTLLAAIAGHLRPDSGRIVLGDRVLFDHAAGICLPPHRRGIGMLFQEPRLLPHLSVAGNIAFVRRRTAHPLSADELAGLVGTLDLAPLLDRRPAGLSGGERQRAALACALAGRPRALLLDEPMTGLDPKRRQELIERLRRLRAAWDLPMLLVSHRLDDLVQLADRLVPVAGGVTGAGGPPAELLGGLLPGMIGGGLAGEWLGGLLELRVTAAADGLLTLAGDFGQLVAPGPARPVGTVVRVRIAARDVMLATAPLAGISASNVLPATIARIAPVAEPAAEADVGLTLGDGTPLVARITTRSCQRLALAPGQAVWAVIKAVQLHD